MTRIEIQLEGTLESQVMQKADELQVSVTEYILTVLQRAARPNPARRVIGLFKGDPELMDELIQDIYESRQKMPMRTPENA